MAKKEKKEKKVLKPKGEGRTPALAAFVDSSFKIYLNHSGKEHEATVLSTGVIRYNDKEYTSPSSVGAKIVGAEVNGWRAWSFNKNGERVPLDVLRGSKSPLAEAPKAKKAVPKPAKPKRSLKPRAPKLPVAEPPTTMAERQAVGA